jgi:hypothetical protein
MDINVRRNNANCHGYGVRDGIRNGHLPSSSQKHITPANLGVHKSRAPRHCGD